MTKVSEVMFTQLQEVTIGCRSQVSAAPADPFVLAKTCENAILNPKQDYRFSSLALIIKGVPIYDSADFAGYYSVIVLHIWYSNETSFLKHLLRSTIICFRKPKHLL